MAVLTTIALATLFLEHDDFVTFNELLLYFAYNLGAFYSGGTYFYCAVGVNEQYFVKLHGGAFLGVFAKIVDIKELVLFSFKLLALNFYNYVHFYVFCGLTPSGGAELSTRFYQA